MMNLTAALAHVAPMSGDTLLRTRDAAARNFTRMALAGAQDPDQLTLFEAAESEIASRKREGRL